MEGYNVPIVALEQTSDYFILDGHHRSYIWTRLKKEKIAAYVLTFPGNTVFRPRLKRQLQDLPIREVSVVEDPILKAWD